MASLLLSVLFFILYMPKPTRITDALGGSYYIGTDDEDDDNNYVAPTTTGQKVALRIGNSRLNVTSRRLANIERFRQELLPPQPLVSTSATAAVAAPAGISDNANRAAVRQRLSQTLRRLADADSNEHRQPTSTIDDSQRRSPEERSHAEILWNSISPEAEIWNWPAPNDGPGFEPAYARTRPDPAGHTGYSLCHELPLTGWEPQLECSSQHPQPHLTLQECITDYEKLFNGDERLNGKVDGQLPITSIERLFFALWAARHHLLPKRNPNNHFEARRPNEHTADFLGALLTTPYLQIPDVVNASFDGVVAGIPAPHFKEGDLRITLLRWYEGCPTAREFLTRHISGPATMELENADLYRIDIRRQLRKLFQEHFASALDFLRLRVYNVRTGLKPMWRTPHGAGQLPDSEDDPPIWCIRSDRILDNENVIFADSWGLHLARPGHALTIIVSGPADRALQTTRRFFLSHRVKNVYWFWGRDAILDTHDVTENWYSQLTEHFVRWFPHVRLIVVLPPYTLLADHHWAHSIKRGVLANLRNYCLNATVICDPLDLKLHDYHEQFILNGSWQLGFPLWPTEEQDAEGNPSADGLRRRKGYMKEKFGITLWDHEADDSMDTDQQAAGQREAFSGPSGSGTAPPSQATGQREASSGPSGSGTAPPTLQPVRRSGIPLPATENDPDAVLITRLREMFPSPLALQTQMLDLSRFLNVLYQLDAVPHTPTWQTIYPELFNVEALNVQGAYKHLVYSTAPQLPDSDAETDDGHSDTPLSPDYGHRPGAIATGGRLPSGLAVHVPHNPGFGHPSVAVAAEGRSPPASSSSDTIRTRNPSTEQRRGTPRASSRGTTAPRAHHLPWLGEGRQGQDW